MTENQIINHLSNQLTKAEKEIERLKQAAADRERAYERERKRTNRRIADTSRSWLAAEDRATQLERELTELKILQGEIYEPQHNDRKHPGF